MKENFNGDLFYVDINKEKIFTFFMSTFLLCVLFFFFSINSYLFQKIISTFQKRQNTMCFNIGMAKIILVKDESKI